MSAYRLRKNGSRFALELSEEPVPAPGKGEAIVRVRAVSLNYRDLVMRQGQYGSGGEGIIPASDGAGEVTAVGEGVERIRPGDRVAGTFFQRWISGPPSKEAHRSALGGDLDGMLAQYVRLSAEGVTPFPEYLSYEQAACLPCAGLTAWNALFKRGALAAGDTVLTQGTGGVSVFAAQFAIAAGATVIGTSSSDEKLARLTAMGVQHTVNYKTRADWDKAAQEYTGGAGVDHVIEVGGVGTMEKSMKAVRVGGHIALIGVLAGRQGGVNPFPIAMKNATLSGIYVGSRADFEAMNSFLGKHRIEPVVDRVFAFDQAPEAYDHLESGAHFGKVVISVD